MNPFKKVDDNNPPKMTVAIGLWISLPGRSPLMANGINAKAELRAVIKMGFNRSNEPCITTSPNGFPSERSCV